MGACLPKSRTQIYFPLMSIDSLTFRNALSSLPAAVSVITTIYKGEKTGITVSSFTSLSLNPPLILFCLDNASKSLGAFSRGKRFVVNLLAEDQKPLAQHFAAAGKKSWAHLHFTENARGLPLLEGCITQLSAIVSARHKEGDHIIIIGKVEHIAPIDKDAKPLLYFRRHYHQLGSVRA